MHPGHPTLALLLLAGCPLLAAAEPRPRLDLYGDPLPPGSLARLGTLRFRAGGAILKVALSPDGKTAASLDCHLRTTTLCLWETASGRLLHRCLAQERGGCDLAFSPDGKLLATVDGANEVWLWDVAAGKVARQCSGEEDDRFFGVCFGANGKCVAAAGSNGIWVWEQATGQRLFRYRGERRDYCTLAFSPDGKMLASAEDDHVVSLRETATGKLLRRCLGHDRDICSLAFSPDGKSLASTDAGGKVWLWQTATGKPIHRDGLPWGARLTLAFSPDGKRLSLDNGLAVEVREVATGNKIVSCRGHWQPVATVCYSSDGKRLLSGGDDGALCLWEAATGKPVRHEVGHGREVQALAFHPDGRTLASGGYDGTVRLWDVSRGRQLCARSEHAGNVASVSFAPDGKRLASAGGSRGEVRVWEVTAGRPLRPVWVKECAATQATFSPDGKTVAAGTSCVAADLYLWDATSGAERRQWLAHRYGVTGLCYSPDGKTLASLGYDRALRFWEAASGRQLQVWPGQPGPLDPALYRALSLPDGRTWALVQKYGTIDRRGVPNGKRLLQILAEKAQAFSPDGRLLATARDAGRLKLYEVATGKKVFSWEGHGDMDVRAVAFTPDGKQLASASRDGTILVWDLALLLHGSKLSPAGLSDREMVALWQALAGSDVRQAYRAIDLLAAAPEQAIPFLQQRLRPVRIDPEHVKRLLAELDSDTFAVREKASQQLAGLGDTVEPALEQTLASGPSLEVRRRVERALDELARQTAAPGRLRQLRSLAVLERAGTAEARQLLRDLAEGEQGARLTGAARMALGRLDKAAHSPDEKKAASCGEK